MSANGTQERSSGSYTSQSTTYWSRPPQRWEFIDPPEDFEWPHKSGTQAGGVGDSWWRDKRDHQDGTWEPHCGGGPFDPSDGGRRAGTSCRWRSIPHLRARTTRPLQGPQSGSESTEPGSPGIPGHTGRESAQPGGGMPK
jgi:hypothetical protein